MSSLRVELRIRFLTEPEIYPAQIGCDVLQTSYSVTASGTIFPPGGVRGAELPIHHHLEEQGLNFLVCRALSPLPKRLADMVFNYEQKMFIFPSAGTYTIILIEE